MRIDPRLYTNKLLAMLSEGLINRDDLILACVNYMSDNDIRDLMESNEMLEEEDEEDEDDGQPTEREEYLDFDPDC